MIPRIPCTVCRTTVSTPINFLLQCCCGISLHHTCVVPAIPQEALLSMIEASTNDRRTNSLQTWQCPNCKTYEASINDKKTPLSRSRNFASSSNFQIEEAYRRMQLKRPIESIYDRPPMITAARTNKKPKGAHMRVKTIAKDTQELEYVTTSSNPGPPSTDLQPKIYKAPTRSKENKNKPLSAECPKVITADCRRTVKSSPKLLLVTDKFEITPISDPPSMNVATNVHSQCEDIYRTVQGSTLTSIHEAQHPAVEDNAGQTTCLNQDKNKSLPPLLDLRKYLNKKILPKRRHNALRPTFSDLDGPPAKRRRLVYHAIVPDMHTGVEGPEKEDAAPSLQSANNNDDLIPVPSSSLCQQLKAPDNPIVTSPDKNTARKTSILLSHTPSKQQQSVVEPVGPTHTIATRPLYIRTSSPTSTCSLALLPSPAITPTILPSSPIELPKADPSQDNLYVQSRKTELGLENDNAESVAGNPSTTSGLLSLSLVLPSSNNPAVNQGCRMEDVASKCSSGICIGAENDVSEVGNQSECAMPDLTESALDDSEVIDRLSGAVDSNPEADQGSEMTEIEALDTPLPIPSSAGSEVEKKDTHVEPSFADGLLSPPPTDDETQFVSLEPPSINKPSIGDTPSGLDDPHAANIRHITKGTPVEKTEPRGSLDNVLKRLPQPPPSFRLSTVTVPVLAKCFRPFGLSTKRAY